MIGLELEGVAGLDADPLLGSAVGGRTDGYNRLGLRIAAEQLTSPPLRGIQG
jgi:hypothetical protein